MPSVALKYNVPFTFVRLAGEELLELAYIFFTITVPASVPSDFHNSSPFVPSVAVKYNIPFTFVKYGSAKGPILFPIGFIFFTITVPVDVPSLFHNSKPSLFVKALKKSVPFTSINRDGSEPTDDEPGFISFTITVPVDVPSLFHNSFP